MNVNIKDFQELFSSKNLIEIQNQYLSEIVSNISIKVICKESQRYQDILEKAVQTRIITIDKFSKATQTYFFIYFDQIIVILSKSDISLIQSFFIKNKNCTIILLSNNIINDLFEPNTLKSADQSQFKFNKYEENEYFQSVDEFSNNFEIKWSSIEIKHNFNQLMIRCQRVISAFLLKKSYEKLNYNKIDTFYEDKKIKTEENIFNKKDIIPLHYLGSQMSIRLIYSIEKEELFILKRFFTSNDEPKNKLFERERKHYLSIQHPFIPKYFGYSDNGIDKYLIIEYIEGNSLERLRSNIDLNIESKMKIIFEMMIVIEYLHDNGFVHRDLKPDNFILCKDNKTIVLIDFDRMVRNGDEVHSASTKNFASSYIPPEIFDASAKNYSFSIDIYSLGLIIYFILFGKEPEININNNRKKIIFNGFSEKYSDFKFICEKCINDDPSKRPPISELIDIFYINFMLKIEKCFEKSKISCVFFSFDKSFPYWLFIDEYNDETLQEKFGIKYKENVDISEITKKKIHYYSLASIHNHLESLFNLGLIYLKDEIIPLNIDKSIYYLELAAKQNHLKSQKQLAHLYKNGKLVQRNMEKSIYYYTLAIEQNDSDAQNDLGLIYMLGELVPKNIEKAYQLFTLAAKQNHSDAQNSLGAIYLNGLYGSSDPNKAIEYFTLSSNQNHINASFNLGLVYYQDKFVPRDINKAIYYFTLSANQNKAKAQHHLGLIYYQNKYVQQDIKKAIYYFTLAANQNYSYSQYYLGLIYYQNQYVPRDAIKSIHYFTLSANQNDPDSQYYLGLIYYEGEIIEKNIHKAIHYFTLAAKQNDPNSQNMLGIIYYNGLSVPVDIDKSIYYFTLSTEQNNSDAQLNLGELYLSDKHSKIDINKGIYYLTLAANQNNSDAQYSLGQIYYEGEIVPRDITKSLHYFNLSAQSNDADALYSLGQIYMSGEFLPLNIEKAKIFFTRAANLNHKPSQLVLGLFNMLHFNTNVAADYLVQSATDKFPFSNFIAGYVYHLGINIEPDIKKAIQYYKKASSFNNQYAKNNLGIIYKNGVGDEIVKNINWAIIYFKEAINQSNDIISMYNLAHIYIYEEPIEDSILESIKLLIKSAEKNFYPSKLLLCLASIMYFGVEVDLIINELNKIDKISNELSKSIYNIIKLEKLEYITVFENKFNALNDIDFIYDYNTTCYPFKEIKKFAANKRKQVNDGLRKNIDLNFYDGFDIK